MDSYEHLSPSGYKTVSIFSAFLFFAGSCTQVLTLIVLFKQEFRKRVLTPCFLSIIVSNFLLLLGSLPTTFVSSLMNGWVFNSKVCHFVGFVSGTGSISMIATMAVITVKIYLLAKNKPFAGNRIKPHGFHTKVLIGVWVYSICAMLPPATGITEMRIEGSGTNCVPNWSPQNTSGRIYVIFLLSVAYIIPVSVSAVYLIKVHREITKNFSETNYYFVNLCFRSLRNINKMCMLAVVFFTIAWLPYATVVLVCVCGKRSFISPEMEMVPTLLAKTTAVFNPFIYSIANPRFRTSVLQVLRIRVSFNNDENDVNVSNDVFALNDAGNNTKTGNVIKKSRRGEREDKTKMKNKSSEKKLRNEEQAANYNDKRQERRSMKNDGESYQREILSPEGLAKDEKLDGKTRRSEKLVNITALSVIQDTESLSQRTSSKESYKKSFTSSSRSSEVKERTSQLSSSSSKFKLEKRFSRPQKLGPKRDERSSSSLRVSVAYREYRTTSYEVNSQNYLVPGSLS